MRWWGGEGVTVSREGGGGGLGGCVGGGWVRGGVSEGVSAANIGSIQSSEDSHKL